jgi:hypothetical protein
MLFKNLMLKSLKFFRIEIMKVILIKIENNLNTQLLTC